MDADDAELDHRLEQLRQRVADDRRWLWELRDKRQFVAADARGVLQCADDVLALCREQHLRRRRRNEAPPPTA